MLYPDSKLKFKTIYNLMTIYRLIVLGFVIIPELLIWLISTKIKY